MLTLDFVKVTGGYVKKSEPKLCLCVLKNQITRIIKAETRHKFPLYGSETPIVILGSHPISACLLPMI